MIFIFKHYFFEMRSGLAMAHGRFSNFWKPQRRSSNYFYKSLFSFCQYSASSDLSHFYRQKNCWQIGVWQIGGFTTVLFFTILPKLSSCLENITKSLYFFRFFLFFMEPCQSLSLISYSCELILNGNKVTRSFKREWKSRDVSLSG